jgi:hypothetical protein
MNQKVTLKEEPGNGSIAKVSFVAAPYFVDGQAMGGLSLYLNAVQIIKLNKAGERSAEDYGFAEEEDGFIGGNAKTADDDAEDLTPAASSGSEANYEEPDF